jgi:N-acetylglucosamine-6-sulfatase
MTADGLGGSMEMKRALIVIGLAAAVAALAAPWSGPAPSSAAAAGARPNVVVVMSDDQTLEEMRFMPKTERLLGRAGATFPDSVTNWPLCCPSRATFMTGQYAHNHGVLGNKEPQGGFGHFDTEHTLPVWLQRSGYYTIHIGKFLNGYEGSGVGVPPGWSDWHGSKLTYFFYGFKLWEAGQIVTYGSESEDPDAPAAPETYSTDVLTDKAVQAIDERAPSDQPFFLDVAYLAPHVGGPETTPDARCANSAKPAIRDAGLLADEPLPQPPSFNEADVSDKPQMIRKLDPMTPEQIAKTTRNYRCRGESMMAVDDGVKRIVDELRAQGELDNTLIIFTSDNGFFHGEHRIPGGKNRVYEEAIRVPLLIRGPGVPRGVEVADETTNADLAATIVDAADATSDFPLDGTSLLRYVRHPERMHGRELLIEQDTPERENGNPRGTEYEAVRTSRWKYVRYWDGKVELYDLRRDPHELQNLRSDRAYVDVKRALAQRLDKLRRCAGETCRKKPALELRLPDPVRKDGIECSKPGDFVAKVRRPGEGSSKARIARVSFRVAGEPTGTVRKPPFNRKLRPRLLRSERKPLVEADAELLDGRILTLSERVRTCR